MATPIRVAIANDYEVVVAGIAACLAPFSERIEVVELVAGVPVGESCDVVLYDTFSQLQGEGLDVRKVGVHTPTDEPPRVIVFSWNDDNGMVDSTLARGAAGFVSKRATAAELVDAIERVHAGSPVRLTTPGGANASTPRAAVGAAATVTGPGVAAVELGKWPGVEVGLTSRESEVLALICQGLSNQEIAERAYLGINTVKTYVRGAYRKVGVTSRSQAVLWGVSHGFAPDRARERPLA